MEYCGQICRRYQEISRQISAQRIVTVNDILVDLIRRRAMRDNLGVPVLLGAVHYFLSPLAESTTMLTNTAGRHGTNLQGQRYG